MTGSLSAYAKHRKERGLTGGSLAAVQKARDTHRIALEPDGRVDFDRADREWSERTNRHQQRSVKESEPKSQDLDAPIEEKDDGSFQEAQRQHEWEKVKKERLARKVREGELVEAAEVEKAWGAILARAKGNLLLLADEIAPRVAVTSDVRECRKIIDSEIRLALTALSESEQDE